MRRFGWSTALTVALLTGCATGYHSTSNPLLGWTGGYWDEPGPGSTIKVGFSGNSIITSDKVSTYLLYRSAEVTQREGGTHFVFYRNLPDAVRDVRSTEKSTGTLGGKPSNYAYIWIVPASERDAIDAADVIRRLGVEVRPQQEAKP
jgi:hypothetical protein